MNGKEKDYGIIKLNHLQRKLYVDVMKLLSRKQHLEITADDCTVVFGRVYSAFVIAQLEKEGKLKVKPK